MSATHASKESRCPMTAVCIQNAGLEFRLLLVPRIVGKWAEALLVPVSISRDGGR